MPIKDPDRDRWHSTELGLTKKSLDAIVEEVAKARGILPYDLKYGNKERHLVSARRAVCMVASDRFMMGYSGLSPISWNFLASFFNQARSTLYHSTDKWRQHEGAEDGEMESHLRSIGGLGEPKETIQEMAVRVARRRAKATPKNQKRELGYWSSKEGVNDG